MLLLDGGGDAVDTDETIWTGAASNDAILVDEVADATEANKVDEADMANANDSVEAILADYVDEANLDDNEAKGHDEAKCQVVAKGQDKTNGQQW